MSINCESYFQNLLDYYHFFHRLHGTNFLSIMFWKIGFSISKILSCMLFCYQSCLLSLTLISEYERWGNWGISLHHWIKVQVSRNVGVEHETFDPSSVSLSTVVLFLIKCNVESMYMGQYSQLKSEKKKNKQAFW